MSHLGCSPTDIFPCSWLWTMNSLDNISILPPQCPPCPLGGGARGAGGEGEHDHGGVFLLFSGILQTDVLRKNFLCAFLQVELHFFDLLFHHMRPNSHLSSPAVKYMFWLATVLPTSWNEQAKKNGPYRCARYTGQCDCALGCPRKTLFQKNKKRNPPLISLGVSVNRSKRIFDLDQV